MSAGPVEKAVAADLKRIDIAPGHAGLAASALTLARTLDEGAGLAVAAVARELRATMVELTKGDDDGIDDGVAALLRDLSATVQHQS